MHGDLPSRQAGSDDGILNFCFSMNTTKVEEGTTFWFIFTAVMPATRQLAAIMFTDMEGYTALMQKNEQAAIERRTRHREIFEKAMTDFGGKIIQYYGDGTLSIFSNRCPYRGY